jgi:antitoxin MazE
LIDFDLKSIYSNYILGYANLFRYLAAMKNNIRTHTIKLVSIGNSKGVRLPKLILQKYGFSDTLILEETDQGILLRQKDNAKLSWEETYKEMAQENEDWSEFENALLDGLDDVATKA